MLHFGIIGSVSMAFSMCLVLITVRAKPQYKATFKNKDSEGEMPECSRSTRARRNLGRVVDAPNNSRIVAFLHMH